MTYRDEIKRLVIIHMLNKYPEVRHYTEAHWSLSYKVVRANMLIETLNWKLRNVSVSI